jgi:hypothetical protein
VNLGKLEEARSFFSRATELVDNKPEAFLYLAVTIIYMYLSDEGGEKEELIAKVKESLIVCIHNLKELSNNFASEVYYTKAVISTLVGDF